MDTDTEQDIEGIVREDVVDAINDPDDEGALELLELYFTQKCGENPTPEALIGCAKDCATILYEAKRYEDVIGWLDAVATKLSDEDGPDSERYMQFAESDVLEDLRMKATDRIFGDEGEIEEDDYDADDE